MYFNMLSQLIYIIKKVVNVRIFVTISLFSLSFKQELSIDLTISLKIRKVFIFIKL